MKKRVLTLLLALTMVLSLLPATAWADVYEGGFGAEGTDFSFNTATKTLTISGNGIIPYRTFSSVYSTWGFPIKDVEKVVIKSGVREIGDSAFRDFTNLKSVTIPNTVTYIGDHAFYWCLSLTSVELPKNLKAIGSNAFYQCSSLTSITIPASVTEIGYAAFGDCGPLTVTFLGDAPPVPAGGYILPSDTTAYYPAGNTTWTEDVRRSLGGGSSTTWVPVCSGSHTLGEWTTVDESTHKRSCTYCDYEETSDHGWDEGSVTTAPTCQATGEALFTCTDCGATKTETLPAGDHPYNQWTEVDDSTHTHACTVCGNEETLPHTWDEGTVITAANCIATGETLYTCTGCGVTRSETVAITGIHTYDHGCDNDCNICGATRTTTHSFGSGWKSSKTDHWHTCVNCGQKDTAYAHTPGPEATEETPQLCTTCDYVLKPTLTHEHDFAQQLTGDESGHWYACATCSEQKDFAAHAFDNDCDTTCDACGYQRTIQHKWSAEWSHDQDGHFHPCTVCGEKNDTAAHDWRRGKCTVCTAEDPNYQPPTVPIVIGAVVCLGAAATVFVRKDKKKKSAA